MQYIIKNQYNNQNILQYQSLNDIILNNLQLYQCRSHHYALFICQTPKCHYPALICNNQQCNCISNHKKCKIKKLQNILNTIKQNKINITENQKQIYLKSLNYINNIIQTLSQQRQKIRIQYQNFGFNKKQIEFINNVKQGNINKINGSLIHQINKKLKFKKNYLLTEKKQQQIIRYELQSSFNNFFQNLAFYTNYLYDPYDFKKKKFRNSQWKNLYQGILVNQKAYGYGKLETMKKSFEGIFYNDQIRNGKLFSKKQQLIFQGSFQKNLLNCKNCLVFQKNGKNTYSGGMKNGRKQGKGKTRVSHQQYQQFYQGFYIDNKQNGFSKITFVFNADYLPTNHLNFSYENHERVQYSGIMENDLKTGEWIIRYINKNNVETDKAKQFYQNGKVLKRYERYNALKNQTYIGEINIQKLESDKKIIYDGYGQEYKQQVVYKGFWKNNRYNGEGQIIFPNGDFFKGKFQNGQIVGKGYFNINVNGKLKIIQGEKWKIIDIIDFHQRKRYPVQQQKQQKKQKKQDSIKENKFSFLRNKTEGKFENNIKSKVQQQNRKK